jgi:hypothetical protein
MNSPAPEAGRRQRIEATSKARCGHLRDCWPSASRQPDAHRRRRLADVRARPPRPFCPLYDEDDVEGHALTLHLPPPRPRGFQKKLLAAGIAYVVELATTAPVHAGPAALAAPPLEPPITIQAPEMAPGLRARSRACGSPRHPTVTAWSRRIATGAGQRRSLPGVAPGSRPRSRWRCFARGPAPSCRLCRWLHRRPARRQGDADVHAGSSRRRPGRRDADSHAGYRRRRRCRHCMPAMARAEPGCQRLACRYRRAESGLDATRTRDTAAGARPSTVMPDTAAPASRRQ